jgi:hypothetical protein
MHFMVFPLYFFTVVLYPVRQKKLALLGTRREGDCSCLALMRERMTRAFWL